MTIETNSPEFNQIIKAAAEAGYRAALDVKQIDWITDVEAMGILGLEKKAMQLLRRNKKITYSQPSYKTILYSRSSIVNFLDNHKIKAK